MAKICPGCGKALPEEASFCLNCFLQVNGTAHSPSAEEAPEKEHRWTRRELKVKPPRVVFLLKRMHTPTVQRLTAVLGMVVCTVLICAFSTRQAQLQRPGTFEGGANAAALLVTNNDGVPVTDENGEKVYQEKAPSFLEKLFGNTAQSNPGTTLSTSADSPLTDATTATGKTTTTTLQDTNVLENTAKPPVSDGLEYTVVHGKIKITGYHGNAENVLVPAEIEGKEVSYIGAGAFANNSRIKTIYFAGASNGTRCFYLPDSTHAAAFKNLPNLTKITFPYETSIYLSNAENTSTTYCDNSVAYLFSETPKLREIAFTEKGNAGSTNNFFAVDGVMYHFRGLVFYPPAKAAKSFTVPAFVKDLFAIRDVPALESLHFSTTTVQYCSAEFTGCTNLKQVVVDDGVFAKSLYYSVDGVLYSVQSGGRIVLKYYPAGKTEKVFCLPQCPTSTYYSLSTGLSANAYLEEIYCPVKTEVWLGLATASSRPPKLKAIHLQRGNTMSQSDVDWFNRYAVTVDYYD